MKKRILLFITIIFTAIIFIHSLLPAEISTIESDSAFGIWDRLSQFMHIPNFLTAISIRKAAHFVQFAVYGILVTSTSFAYNSKIKDQIFKILFILLSVPVADEFTQYFSEGRSAQVSDIVLDFCGCLTGFLITFAVLAVIYRIQKKSD